MAIDWKKDQPAVTHLRKWVFSLLPEVAYHWAAWKNTAPGWKGKRNQTENHELHGVGGYVPRTTKKGGFSRHSEGRAADIYVKTGNPLLKAMGDELFAGFVALSKKLDLEEVIWNGQEWTSKNPSVHPLGKGDDPHTDHVHVGFSRAGSQHTSVEVVKLLGGVRKVVDARFP